MSVFSRKKRRESSRLELRSKLDRFSLKLWILMTLNVSLFQEDKEGGENPEQRKTFGAAQVDFMILRNSASSIHWLSSSIFTCSFVRPALYHLILSPLYDVSDHTNHKFPIRIWSWHHVSVIHCWVEPSVLLSSYTLCVEWQAVCKSVKLPTVQPIYLSLLPDN